jgi:hypothetical protein
MTTSWLRNHNQQKIIVKGKNQLKRRVKVLQKKEVDWFKLYADKQYQFRDD